MGEDLHPQYQIPTYTYLMRLCFHWRQIPMVTYGDVGKQTSLPNQRNTYIHIAFTMDFAILRLLYPYMRKSCVHMVFWFENTTFQHSFTCGDSWGNFFTQWNYYDFSKLGIHSVYVCVAFTLAETFGVTFGDRWGAEFHAAEHPQYNVGVTTGDPCIK